jgi:hypothetical protein
LQLREPEKRMIKCSFSGMESAHPLIELFRSPAVNNLSTFSLEAAKIRVSDLRSWFSVEVSNSPRRHLRNKKYFVHGHKGYPVSKAFSNRLEEHLAMALWNWFRNSSMALPDGDEMAILDYQVPLKAYQSDKYVGERIPETTKRFERAPYRRLSTPQ